MSKYKKFFCMFLILLLAVCLLSTTAFAAGTGDVAGAIEGTWNDASDQIKTVVIKEMKVLICTEFPAHSWRHKYTNANFCHRRTCGRLCRKSKR